MAVPNPAENYSQKAVVQTFSSRFLQPQGFLYSFFILMRRPLYNFATLKLPYFTASLFYSLSILQPPYFTAFGLYRSLDSYNTGFLKGFRFYERKRSIHLSDRIVKRLLAFLRIEIVSISTPCDWKNEGRGANAVTERRAM